VGGFSGVAPVKPVSSVLTPDFLKIHFKGISTASMHVAE
jgi:hypothetical protein